MKISGRREASEMLEREAEAGKMLRSGLRFKGEVKGIICE